MAEGDSAAGTNTSTADSAAAAGSACTPSALGYKCSVAVDGGPIIHYSLGGAPPDNRCTRGTVPPGAAADEQSETLAHFAAESSAEGYVALAFPEVPGKMWPAVAVMGRLEEGEGGAAPQAQAYVLRQYSVSPSDKIQGFAVFKAFYVEGEGPSILCFSRDMALGTSGSGSSDAGSGSSSANNNVDGSSGSSTGRRRLHQGPDPQAAVPASVALNWAESSGHALDYHDRKGSVTLDLRDGGAVVGDPTGAAALADAARIAHGALMAAAFLLLIPTAVLLPRHKWLFGTPRWEGRRPPGRPRRGGRQGEPPAGGAGGADPEKAAGSSPGRLRPTWFYLHVALQVGWEGVGFYLHVTLQICQEGLGFYLHVALQSGRGLVGF